MTFKVPAHITRIGTYVPGRSQEEAGLETGGQEMIKLASNENPLGPSSHAVRALREGDAQIHRYPDSQGVALRRALAARLGVDPSWIVLGNGSTEIVELLAKTFLAAGAGAVAAEQTFIMYHIAVRAMAAPLTCVPLVDDRHDLERMARACDRSTALIYVGNPNNPSGCYITQEELAAFLDRVPQGVLTVLDEAYRDYVEAPDYADGIRAVREGRPVVVLRTFSKIHGLAGLRIGYAITSPEVARVLNAVRSPFNTSSVAQRAAIAALEDTGHVARSRDLNRREMRFMEAELRRRGIRFAPSVANFILVKAGRPGEDVARDLLHQGVSVRPMEAYGYPDAIRVTIGSRTENIRFLQALDVVTSTPKSLSGRRVQQS